MTHDNMANRTTPKNEAATTIGSVASDLRMAATQKFEDTVSEARSQASDAKASMAGEVKDVALALRRASKELRGGSAQERTLGQIADGLADASDALRDKDLGEIVQTATKIARDNPVLFLGGAILMGFAASRYAKATSGNARTTGKRSAPNSSGETGNAFGFVHNDDPAGSAP